MTKILKQNKFHKLRRLAGRLLQDQLGVNHIQSPLLKKETVEFYNDCYLPSYDKYMAGNLSQSQQTDIEQALRTNGKNDIGWLGSQAFLTTPGFYDRFAAQTPVPGFLFDPTRDQFEGQVSDHSKWGQPSCEAWWSDPEHGLNIQLEKDLTPGFLRAISHLPDEKAIAEIGVKHLIRHSFDPGFSDASDIPRGYESLNDVNGSHWYVQMVAKLGIVEHQFEYYPKLYLLINALPVIQALLLLAVYALLALMVPFSSYRLHFIITGSAIIFSITFWSYLWYLIGNINNALIGALYPAVEHSKTVPLWESLLQSDSGLNAVFVHFIIGTLYIVLPALFLTLCSWAGLKISNVMAKSIADMQSPASHAGQAGGSTARALTWKTLKSIIASGK